MPQGQPPVEDRCLRRARRPPGSGVLLPPGRAGLRLLLTLPGAGRPARSGPRSRRKLRKRQSLGRNNAPGRNRAFGAEVGAMRRRYAALALPAAAIITAGLAAPSGAASDRTAPMGPFGITTVGLGAG